MVQSEMVSTTSPVQPVNSLLTLQDLSNSSDCTPNVYFHELMMEVGIEPEFVKRSEYKSAPEQYTHREGSEHSKEQTSELLDAIFGHMTTEIAQNRNIPVETLVALIDQAPFANTQARTNSW